MRCEGGPKSCEHSQRKRKREIKGRERDHREREIKERSKREESINLFCSGSSDPQVIDRSEHTGGNRALETLYPQNELHLLYHSTNIHTKTMVDISQKS